MRMIGWRDKGGSAACQKKEEGREGKGSERAPRSSKQPPAEARHEGNEWIVRSRIPRGPPSRDSEPTLFPAVDTRHFCGNH
jgi:hypothetical protein